MPNYFLFRGETLVDKADNSTSIGAGNLHDLGQPGDILVCIEQERMRRFAWSMWQNSQRQAHWIPVITSNKTEAKYRLLILLQT